MLKFIKVLTWEYISECGLLVLAVMAMLIFGPMAFGFLIGAYGAENLYTVREPLKFYDTYLGIAAFAWLTPPLFAITQTAQRHRSLPVSTRALASVTLLLSVLIVVTANVLTQLIYFWHSDIQWPIVTTTVSVGAFAALAMAGGWWLRAFRTYKVFVGAAVITAWGYWLLRHCLDERLRKPIRLWDTLSASDAVIFLITFAMSWAIMVRSMRRFRCGEADEGWLWTQFVSAQTSVMELINDPRSMRLGPLRGSSGPDDALKVMNWENSRSWQWIGNGLMTGFMTLAALAALRGHGNSLKGCQAMSIMFAAMAGVLAGSDIWMKKKGGMRPFMATLPVSDRSYAETMFLSCLKSATISWAITASGCVIFLLITTAIRGVDVVWGQYQQLWSVRQFGHWAIPIHLSSMAIVCWVCAGLTRAFSSTGETKLIVAAFLTTEFTVIGVGLLINLGGEGSPWAATIGRTLAVALAAAFGVVATIFLFGKAIRQQLIAASSVLASVVVMTLLCTAVTTMSPIEPFWKVVYGCLMGLVIAPVAAIPCAIQFARHR